MTEKLAGIIRNSEFLEEIVEGFSGRGGIMLRPDGEWVAPITIFRAVKLLFPDGQTYSRQVLAGEILTVNPGIVIEPIPEVSNDVPPGTEVYVEAD